ncbi:MAG: hypothetical protein ACUZ8E_17890 [Candidatus Anammoxibacter sp.]
MKKALIRESDNIVENIIVLEEGVKFQPPEGYYIASIEGGKMGDSYDSESEEFTSPIVEEIKKPPSQDEINTAFSKLIAAVNKGEYAPQEVLDVKQQIDDYDSYILAKQEADDGQ